MVSSQTWTTFTIYDIFLLKPWYLAAIKIAEPQRPFGLLPVVIQALFIDYNNLRAVSATWWDFPSNSNLEQNLWMNIEGSMSGISKNNLYTNFK